MSLFTPLSNKLNFFIKKKPPLGGGSADPERNIALFNAVKKSRADGVPKANIESALQKVRVRGEYHARFNSLISLLRRQEGKMGLGN